MKKISLALSILLLSAIFVGLTQIGTVKAATVIVDSCPESNFVTDHYIWLTQIHPTIAGDDSAAGQTFAVVENVILDKATFYIVKLGNPTGLIRAEVYLLTGNFGVDAVPIGSALAISDEVSVSSVATSIALYEFTFSGANRITLQAGVKYGISLMQISGECNFNNCIKVGSDLDGGAHSGNGFHYYFADWGYRGYDYIFYIYGEGITPTPTPTPYNPTPTPTPEYPTPTPTEEPNITPPPENPFSNPKTIGLVAILAMLLIVLLLASRKKKKH